MFERLQEMNLLILYTFSLYQESKKRSLSATNSHTQPECEIQTVGIDQLDAYLSTSLSHPHSSTCYM